MYILVCALLETVLEGPALWPGLGVFSIVESRRMPGFPRHKRLRFQMSPHLFRTLNEGRPPPDTSLDGSTEWIPDPSASDHAIRVIEDALIRTGSALVPGLGRLVVERRELADLSQFFVVLCTEPDALRGLNPSEDAYEAALRAEYPDGVPDSPGGIEA